MSYWSHADGYVLNISLSTGVMTERELWGKSFKMRSSDLRHCHSFIPFKVARWKVKWDTTVLKGPRVIFSAAQSTVWLWLFDVKSFKEMCDRAFPFSSNSRDLVYHVIKSHNFLSVTTDSEQSWTTHEWWWMSLFMVVIYLPLLVNKIIIAEHNHMLKQVYLLFLPLVNSHVTFKRKNNNPYQYCGRLYWLKICNLQAPSEYWKIMI